MRASSKVRPFPRLMIALAGVFQACLAAPAFAAVPVEGDNEALELFLDALRSNTSQFPHGQMEFRCTYRFVPRGSEVLQTLSGQGSVAWSGDRERWKVSYSGIAEGGSPTAPIVSDLLVIRNGRDSFSYSPPGEEGKHGVAKIAAGRRIDLLPLFEYATPSKWGYFERDRFTWAETLDPAAAGPLIEKMAVSRQGQDIRIDVHLRPDRTAVVRGSFANGGNVITYDWPGDPNPPPKVRSFGRRGSYEWSKTPDGRWIPERTQVVRYETGRPDEVLMEFASEIVKFDAKEPEDRLFDFRSVALPAGTEVMSYDRTGRTRRRRIGRDGDEVNQAVLDDLAREVGAEGFAAPEK